MNSHNDNSDNIIGPVNSAIDNNDPQLDQRLIPSSEVELHPAKKRKITGIDVDDGRKEPKRDDGGALGSCCANDTCLRNKQGGSSAEENRTNLGTVETASPESPDQTRDREKIMTAAGEVGKSPADKVDSDNKDRGAGENPPAVENTAPIGSHQNSMGGEVCLGV